MILDANVVIAALNREDAHHEVAVSLIAGSAPEPLRIPGLILAESLVAHARAGTQDRACRALDDLGVTTVPEPDPLGLARLRADAGLRMPDCVVLLAAEHSGEPLATLDRQLAAVARERGVAVLPAD